MAAVYWGALIWWQKESLFGEDTIAQMKALKMVIVSFI